MNLNTILTNNLPGGRSAVGFRSLRAVAGILLGAVVVLGQSAEDLRLTVGKSVVIDYPSDIRQISTSSPDIVDASPVTTREILLHGKGLGNATLVVWSKTGERTFYNVTVDLNLDSLRKILKDSFPNEQIVPESSRDSLTLNGRVSNKDIGDRAVALAATYSKTVVNNLLITNNIELPRPVRTRVLTTSPLETFSVGNTIVVSRGLIDVLPDEGSLAMVLSHELSHIVLGHNLGSQYAFNDRMLFSDEGTYQNLGFKHIPEEEIAADKKAIEMLKASPYAQKLESAGLFVKALQARAPSLSALLQAHLGNNITENGIVTRMAALATSAPALDWNKLDQIAALPLGGRVKLNPWDDKVEIVKAQPVAITSARDKMPFEVTPFYPRLSRYSTASAPAATTAATPATAATTANATPTPTN